MNQNLTKNLLDRFSCSLIGRGKKISGHKILLEALFSLRQNIDKNLLNLLLQKNIVEEKLALKNSFSNGSSKMASESLKNKIQFKKEKSKLEISSRNDYNLDKVENREKKAHNSIKKKQGFVLDQNFELKSRDSTQNNLPLLLKNLSNKSICKMCIDNVKPILETRKVRKGRITYRVPLVAPLRRQEGKAIALLIENTTSRSKSSLKRSANSELIQQTHSLPKATYNRADASRLLPTKFENKQNKKLNAGKKDTKLIQKNIFFSDSFQTLSTNKNELFQLPFLEKGKFSSIKHSLSKEFFDSFLQKGESIDKKKQIHQFALQNRAYLHYRWW